MGPFRPSAPEDHGRAALVAVAGAVVVLGIVGWASIRQVGTTEPARVVGDGDDAVTFATLFDDGGERSVPALIERAQRAGDATPAPVATSRVDRRPRTRTERRPTRTTPNAPRRHRAPTPGGTTTGPTGAGPATPTTPVNPTTPTGTTPPSLPTPSNPTTPVAPVVDPATQIVAPVVDAVVTPVVNGTLGAATQVVGSIATTVDTVAGSLLAPPRPTRPTS